MIALLLWAVVALATIAAAWAVANAPEDTLAAWDDPRDWDSGPTW